MKKKIVEEHIGSIDVHDLEGGVKEAANKLMHWAEVEGYEEVTFRVCSSWCYECPGESSLTVIGHRYENDKEFERRKKKSEAAKKAAKVRKEKKREKELKELARLKKKYEEA